MGTLTNLLIVGIVGMVLAVNCMPTTIQNLEDIIKWSPARVNNERDLQNRIITFRDTLKSKLRSRDKTTDNKRVRLQKRIEIEEQNGSAEKADDFDLIFERIDLGDGESGHFTTQSFYPDCLMPQWVFDYLKDDTEIRQSQYLFFNMSQVDRVPTTKYIFKNATLTLFRHELIPNISSDKEVIFCARAFMIRKGIQPILIDKAFLNPALRSSIDLNFTKALEIWHTHPEKNLGLFISVLDEGNNPVEFQRIFRRMDCSGGIIPHPIPKRLQAYVTESMLNTIYQKMLNDGSNTDLETFAEAGLNKKKFPILDFVLRIMSVEEQLENGELELAVQEVAPTPARLDPESLKNIPIPYWGFYPNGIPDRFTPNTTMRPQLNATDDFESLGNFTFGGNGQFEDSFGMPVDNLASGDNSTEGRNETESRGSEDGAVVDKSSLIQLILDLLLING